MALPEDVLRFVQSSIGSVWDLELLLLLHRDRSRLWTAEALVRELRGSPALVAGALSALMRAQLAVKEADEKYRYNAATPALDALVDQLDRAYSEFPFAVSQAIFSAPSDKIRVFADAFRLKKD